jgi:hypothetical protein
MNFILEGHLPGSQACRLIVEDEIVSLLPNDPSTNHEDLHEERVSKLHLGKIQLLMDILIVISGDANNKPFIHSSRAVKEEMFNRFFNVLTA